MVRGDPAGAGASCRRVRALLAQGFDLLGEMRVDVATPTGRAMLLYPPRQAWFSSARRRPLRSRFEMSPDDSAGQEV